MATSTAWFFLFLRESRFTSACVCHTDVSKKTLDVQSIEGFSSYHNFAYETGGVHVWKSYGIGPGKLIPYDSLFKRHKSSTDLVVVKDFFPFKDSRLYKSARASGAEKDGVFPCPESGCQMIFEKFSDVESHLDVGDHTPGKLKMESIFDKLRREWAQKFSTVDQVKESASTDCSTAASSKSTGFRSELPVGWALQSPRRGAPRFSAKVKEYLIAKFYIGEKTRDKADPTQVTSHMRSAKEASWRDGTKKQYSTYITKWQKFCNQRQISHIQPSVVSVLDFLTLLYQQGLTYSAINTARSALSSYITLENGTCVGQHPLVSRLMKGIFQEKPPRPKYTEIWDVSIVLSHLRSLSPVDKLSLKELTLKLVVLILLVSGQRGRTVHLLSIDHMVPMNNCYTFQIVDHLKQSRPGVKKSSCRTQTFRG